MVDVAPDGHDSTEFDEKSQASENGSASNNHNGSSSGSARSNDSESSSGSASSNDSESSRGSASSNDSESSSDERSHSSDENDAEHETSSDTSRSGPLIFNMEYEVQKLADLNNLERADFATVARLVEAPRALTAAEIESYNEPTRTRRAIEVYRV